MNVRETIDCLCNFPVAESILICGDQGRGKSAVVKEAGKLLNIPVIDFRLSQNDVGDLKGMPYHVNGRTVFMPPEWVPLTEEDASTIKKLLNLTNDISLGKFGDKGIIFFDEINRATREVQQACFEYVLDRRMNLRSLPDGWRVVSAVNDDDDIYNVNAMDPAFLSRFFVVKFEPTQQEWFSYAEKAEIHPAVVDFLRRYPDFLDPTKESLKEAASKGLTKVCDRRSWTKFSSTLKKLSADADAGKRPDPLSKEAAQLNFLTLTAQGYVGHIASVKFRGFIESDYQALDAGMIINKFNKDVSDRLENVVKIGRIMELQNYNQSILALLKKMGKMTKAQGGNLYKYLAIVPKEVQSDFWSAWTEEESLATMADAWYNEDITHEKLIIGCLVNPNSKSVK